MTVKQCFGKAVPKGSRILLFGQEMDLLSIEHLNDNIYEVAYLTGVDGDDESTCRVSAEHEVIVPVSKSAKSGASKPKGKKQVSDSGKSESKQ